MPNHWIAVSGEANFEKTKELGFQLQGFKTRQRRKAERMAEGDKLVWYITNLIDTFTHGSGARR